MATASGNVALRRGFVKSFLVMSQTEGGPSVASLQIEENA